MIKPKNKLKLILIKNILIPFPMSCAVVFLRDETLWGAVRGKKVYYR
jgi:hypothetical protein